MLRLETQRAGGGGGWVSLLYHAPLLQAPEGVHLHPSHRHSIHNHRASRAFFFLSNLDFLTKVAGKKVALKIQFNLLNF